MAEMTLEQKRAIALARARLRVARVAELEGKSLSVAPASAADMAIGSMPVRAAMGAAQAAVGGPFQFGANLGDKLAEKIGMEPVVGKWVNRKQQELGASKRRGMNALGASGFDWAGLGGAVIAGGAKPLTGGVVPGLREAATSIPGKVAQGGVIGTTFGAMAPVTADDYDEAAKLNAAAGGFFGAAVPLTAAGVKAGYRTAEEYLPKIPFLTRAPGIDIVSGRILNLAAGDRRPAVVAALKGNRQIVPGSSPTAGEAASPAGSAEFSGIQEVV